MSILEFCGNSVLAVCKAVMENFIRKTKREISLIPFLQFVVKCGRWMRLSV